MEEISNKEFIDDLKESEEITMSAKGKVIKLKVLSVETAPTN